MFTPGNIITLSICVILILVFRQLDKNGRTLEKIKKFGDKLKDDLDAFVKERTSKLEESAIALTVEQTKAVAAVKRLESIRDDLAKKEETLMLRTREVEDFGKKISSYDATVKQLIEMTTLAETNLSRITDESDFADSLGKKLAASQKQLAEIAASIPAMRDSFAAENRAALESIQRDTLERISATIADLDRKVEAAHRSGTEMAATAAEKLKDVYQRAYTEAARRADQLEDASFAKLKEQALERLQKYKDQIEEKTSTLHEQTKDKLQETQQLAKGFKADWQREAEEYLETARAEMSRLSDEFGASVASLSDRLKDAENLGDAKTRELRAELDRFESDFRSSLDACSADVETRLARFEGITEDTARLEGQLRLAMQKAEQRVTDDFSLFAQDQQGRQGSFEKGLLDSASALQGRMDTLESGLNELKSRAYDNVSSKLKMFEDDFFADLAKRSDAITASLDGWKVNVDERLSSLSAESEGARKDLETAYATELKERLSEIAERHRAQTARLEEQVAGVETELRARITASDQSILSFIEQSRAEFAQAKDTAALHVKNELDAHALSVQETLRKQQREVESRTKEYVAAIDNSRSESEAILAGIKNDFAAWQAKREQQLADAESILKDRAAKIEAASRESCAALESAWQANYREFVAKTADERKALKESVDGLRKEAAQALSDFSAAASGLSAEADRRARESAAETEQTVKALKSMVQEVRDGIESTREKAFLKIQSDAASLGQTVEEIDRKQKAFVAQTRVFERADELKVALESGIESLKGELGRLDVYRDAMGNLEQQYQRIRKLEEETTQKVTRFMTEKKRIDILEADFSKLLGLSDSMDKKIAELTGTNDEIQQYQVQIRRFEETLAEASSRFERLDKKVPVLDQTVEGVDRAFEGLKGVDATLAKLRAELSGMPAELEGMRRDIDALLGDKEKTDLMVERLSSLDSILEDVEKRTAKMQTAREWLARTETRLEEISKQSQDQLKLLGDLLKEEGPAKKTKGAPPIGIRENVVKLAHQGWKVDEIARALHLSRGEVELILELPQK